MNNWSVVVHLAAARHYRLRCEYTIPHGISEAYLDYGISEAHPLRSANTPARLLALLRRIVARPWAIAGHGSAEAI